MGLSSIASSARMGYSTSLVRSQLNALPAYNVWKGYVSSEGVLDPAIVSDFRVPTKTLVSEAVPFMKDPDFSGVYTDLSAIADSAKIIATYDWKTTPWLPGLTAFSSLNGGVSLALFPASTLMQASIYALNLRTYEGVVRRDLAFVAAVSAKPFEASSVLAVAQKKNAITTRDVLLQVRDSSNVAAQYVNPDGTLDDAILDLVDSRFGTFAKNYWLGQYPNRDNILSLMQFTPSAELLFVGESSLTHPNFLMGLTFPLFGFDLFMNRYILGPVLGFLSEGAIAHKSYEPYKRTCSTVREELKLIIQKSKEKEVFALA